MNTASEAPRANGRSDARRRGWFGQAKQHENQCAGLERDRSGSLRGSGDSRGQDHHVEGLSTRNCPGRLLSRASLFLSKLALAPLAKRRVSFVRIDTEIDTAGPKSVLRPAGCFASRACRVAGLFIALCAHSLSHAVDLPTWGIQLAWDPNPEPDIAGYRILYGNDSSSCTNVLDVGNVVRVAIIGLSQGQNYVFKAKAYNLSGLESDPSAEVSAQISKRFAIDTTASPVNPTVTNTPSGIGFSTALSLNLSWPTNSMAEVSGYRLEYGLATNAMDVVVDVGDVTRLTLVGLTPSTEYFFTVKAYTPSGTEEGQASPVALTSPAAVSTNLLELAVAEPWVPTVSPPILVDQAPTVPPLPPMPPGMVPGTNSGSTGTTGPVAQTPGIDTVPEIPNREERITSVPPRLSMTRNGAQASMTVAGTVGAVYELQVRAGYEADAEWTTVTNLTVTNLLALANNDGSPVDLLAKAFPPGTEVWSLPGGLTAPMQVFRLVMRDSYPLLANQNLREQDVQSRLVAVRLPGIDSYVICYVPQEQASIDYVSERATLRLLSSGETVRQIATKVASTLTMNWTSASEFTYTNGISQLVATVVKTDDPANDPLPGGTGSTIKIDF